MSKLFTSPEKHLFYHRLCSLKSSNNNVDIYELVSTCGNLLRLLRIDFYYKTKTRPHSQGLNLANRCDGFTGTNNFLEIFPIGIQEANEEIAMDATGYPSKFPFIMNIDVSHFQITKEHLKIGEEIITTFRNNYPL